jgi:hypothetical protein
VGPDEEGLVIQIADRPDADPGVEGGNLGVKFAPELGILDIVYHPDEPARLEDGQPAPPSPKVGMIIGPVKQVGDTILVGRHTEKTAHAVLLDPELL